ncbi:MAG: DUF4349 domain-containing protein [Deltaproteobacteria bacterium]|nr:DUF4349 domain-containing protein [Deltaproteobacteria bacterium]
MKAMMTCILVAAAAGGGCAAKRMPAPAAPSAPAAGPMAASAPATTATPQPAVPQAVTTTTTTTTTKAPAVALASAGVIYTGGVTMLEEAEKIPSLIDAVIELAEAQGGRVQARRDDGVAIRVPSAVFRETMSKLDRLGVVTQRSIAADDVAEEMHDAEVRLANLQATRKRLQELFAKANDIPATLTIEKELERVAQEIDRVEGRLRFLQARTALSTIDVRVAAKPKPVVAAAPATAAEPMRPLPQGIVLPIAWLDDLDATHLTTFQGARR